MFIRVEGSSQIQRTIECKICSVHRQKQFVNGTIELYLDDSSSPYILGPEDSGHWHIAFMMNQDGETFDRVMVPGNWDQKPPAEG